MKLSTLVLIVVSLFATSAFAKVPSAVTVTKDLKATTGVQTAMSSAKKAKKVKAVKKAKKAAKAKKAVAVPVVKTEVK